MVAVLTPDTTRPRLLSYNISLDAGQLYLLFDEAVNYSSVDTTLISLWSTSSGMGTAFQLTTASGSDGPNSDLIIVDIARQDLDIVKDYTDLATSENDTVLALVQPAVRDMSDNDVVSVYRVFDTHPMTFFPDITSPELDDFNLDLNIGTLALSFSETINPANFNITSIVLQNSSMSSAPSFTVMPSSTYQRIGLSTILVNFSLSDLNAIKADENLATSPNNTFLVIDSLAAEDRNGNALVPILSNNSKPVTEFTNDSTLPYLVSFVIDFDNGNLTLSFSETVNTTSLDLTQVTLSNNPSAGVSYNLTGGMVAPEFTDVLRVNFLKVDRDEITRLHVCTRQEDCFISFSSLLVEDMSTNPVQPIELNDPQPVLAFIADQSSTTLVAFRLFDLNMGVIRLEFEETIDVSSINLTALSVQDFPSAAVASVQLSGGTVVTSNGTFVEINITNDDLNLIKARTILCTDRVTNCFIRLKTTFARDTFGNFIVPVVDSSMILSNSFPDVLVPDTTPPELLSFNLNLTSETLILFFSETVDYTTFETRFITFVNDQENTTVSISLNNIVGDSLFTQEYLPYMRFRIAADDVDRLQAESRVATGVDDTFIVIDSSLVMDTSGNAIVQILSNDSLGVTNFTADSIQPMFVAFTQLDMNEGIITLSFSEPIESDSIIFSAFTLHNVETGDNVSFTLTSGSTMYADAVHRSLQIIFSPQDLRSVKLLQQLAVSLDTSYLSFTDGAINDTAQNPIDGISSNMSVQADDYIGDETRPLLLNFTLDMDDGLLDLTFDDVFDRETLMPQHITLQSESSTEPNSSYTLQQGSSISPDGFSITINLAKIDLDEIKMRSRLATSMETTYISLSSQIGRDIAGNPVTAIVIDEAVQVLNFTEDTTDPFLERFSLDLNVEVSGIDRGTITLVFSEAINVTSLDLRELTLQNTQNGSESSEVYRLTGGDLNPAVTGVTIVVTLTKYDTDNLKELTFLGTTVNDTFISFPDTLIADMNNNPIIPIDQFNATMAAGLTADIIPPEIIKFSLDLDGAPCLELTFSETVNVSSLDATRIILQSSAEDPPLSSFQLTGGNVTSINDTVVRVCFTLSDANNVKRLRQLATSPTNTFLRFEFGMVYDNGGNAIQEIAPSSAVQILVDCYTEDTTQPKLIEFDFDLTSDMLTLYFTETVSIIEFNFTGITIISGFDPDSEHRQLIGGNIDIWRQRYCRHHSHL